jgi:hypothetical protein
MVQTVEKLSNRLIDIFQPEEGLMIQGGNDPALSYLYTDFGFSLVPRTIGPRWHYADPMVHGHLLIGRARIGIVAAGSEKDLIITNSVTTSYTSWSRAVYSRAGLWSVTA